MNYYNQKNTNLNYIPKTIKFIPKIYKIKILY